MDVLAWVELVALAVAFILVAPLVYLFLRRRWLARQGAMFECSLRLNKSTPGTGWVLGVARYSEDNLEWFRIFSLSFQPRMTFHRPRTWALREREPSSMESVVLFDGQHVVSLALADRDQPDEQASRDALETSEWELAMSASSLTGLRSWLEAAPPGEH